MSQRVTNRPTNGLEPNIIQPSDIIIPVMGETGSGKSTFVSLCTGEDVGVGHGQHSFTADVSMQTFRHEGYTIQLIDTPGFDDTKVSDTQILKDIAYWLGQAYSSQPKILLSGIVYLHPIHGPRVQGTAKKNLEMFKEVCGKESLACVVLGTTMWSKISMQKGMEQLEYLVTRDELWGEMVKHGSKVFQHKNTRDSALTIIEHIIQKKPELPPIVLKIQRQMCEGKEVHQTDAGQKLQGVLIKERDKARDRLQRNKEELAESLYGEEDRNNDHLLQLQEGYKKKIEDKEKALASLRVDFATLSREKEEQMKREEEQMALQRKEHNEAIANLKIDINEADKKTKEAIAAFERQEQMQATLEMNNSALILQRDENSGRELVRMQAAEKEKLAVEETSQKAELQVLELKAFMQNLQIQLQERERTRQMEEAKYMRRISARQLKVAGASLAIAVMAFSCSVM